MFYKVKQIICQYRFLRNAYINHIDKIFIYNSFNLDSKEIIIGDGNLTIDIIWIKIFLKNFELE
jgi:hypothetical protein